jgi:hypothetical protein
MSHLLDSALDHVRMGDILRQEALASRPWNSLRDPELPRTPPVQRPTGHEAARTAFLGAIQDGRDVFLRSERGADLCVSRHLGELCEEARELLFKAAHEAKCGRPSLCMQYVLDMLDAEANSYADHNEGEYL